MVKISNKIQNLIICRESSYKFKVLKVLYFSVKSFIKNEDKIYLK